MSSIKKITKNLEKKYWFYTALCPLVMIGEVIFETVIPFLMAFIIDNGIAARYMPFFMIVHSAAWDIMALNREQE